MAAIIIIFRRLILVGPILVVFFFPLLTFLAHPWIKRDWYSGLIGVTSVNAKDRPRLNISSWNAGLFQKNFSAWFESNCPGREFYLRLFNQINYSVFSSSYMLDRNLIVGPDAQLDNLELIRDTVHQGDTEAENVKFMQSLLKLKSRLQQQGKKLLLLTTPSKASVYPETIPAYLQGFDQHQPLFQAELIEFLDQAHIPYVDGTAILQRLAPSSTYPFFERGGLHWNTYAAAQLVNPLLVEVSKITGQPVPLPSRIDGVYLPTAASDEAPEKDLAGLLNVLWPPLDYRVAHASFTYQSKPPGEPPRIILAGDSFGEQLAAVLNQAPYQELPTIARTQYDMYFMGRSTENRISREVYKQLLAKSDVVVIEVNQLPSHQRIANLLAITDESVRPEKLFPLGTNISFAKEGTGADYTVEGFKDAEEDGRWTNALRATLWMTLPAKPDTYRFSAEVGPYLNGPGCHQRVEVRFHGEKIAEADFQNGESHTLQAVFSASGQVELEFLMPDAGSPTSGQEPDSNMLGLKFHSMRLVPVFPGH